MKIIDAHLHFSEVKRFRNCAEKISQINYSMEGLKEDFESNEIVTGIAMGLEETHDKAFPDAEQRNPMEANLEGTLPSWLKYCLGINPLQLKNDPLGEFLTIERKLQEQAVVGIKLYPGYYPVAVTNAIYRPIYHLAEAYGVPVTIHCGKTYAVKGYLHDSHPLLVNQVALQYPNVKFIIAHLGDPWVMDTAAIISNNSNVFADLSGLVIGDQQSVRQRMESKLFVEHIQRALDYAASYDKILYGSDWPLVQLNIYINWIKGLIAQQYHKDVFYENAIKVYDGLLK
ncbi:amidohydrolase 2 [Alkaliphilus metalliredigens QYMF]|uniref:Amidohydrolase 2 n=1 Tax=Alkaliphilus metalliredigens (strain QYMF) TaxID=293826 RepID=A6TVX3_ALKMQ|nr:amidohydrolase family protein [Alkaliphilus metalliredigens]ABR50341.1 amidohydrolase 2 [Alkaliphilus metalliredigens QYMF]